MNTEMMAARDRIAALEGAIQAFIDDKWTVEQATVKFKRILHGGDLNDVEKDIVVVFLCRNQEVMRVNQVDKSSMKDSLRACFSHDPRGFAFADEITDGLKTRGLSLRGHRLKPNGFVYGVFDAELTAFIKEVYNSG